mgnify:CR=1 FL=1
MPPFKCKVIPPLMGEMSATQTKGGVYAVKVATRSVDGEIVKAPQVQYLRCFWRFSFFCSVEVFIYIFLRKKRNSETFSTVYSVSKYIFAVLILFLLLLPKLGMCRPFQSCQERRISLPFQECTVM